MTHTNNENASIYEFEEKGRHNDDDDDDDPDGKKPNE